MRKLGIVGIGNMGKAILSRILKNGILDFSEIAVYDSDIEKQKSLPNDIFNAKSAQELFSLCEIVMLAVKPKQSADIFKEVTVNDNFTLISIMAGVKIASMRAYLGEKCGIVRVMPNLPCQIGAGVSGLCFDNVSENHASTVISIFSACGDTVLVKEEEFDALTSISGSGPAYVYYFANALIEGGIKGGLSFDNAKKLALNTIIGTAKMALSTDESLKELIKKVCSEGGTTIEAVKVFEARGMHGIICDGIEACKNKSEFLSKNSLK